MDRLDEMRTIGQLESELRFFDKTDDQARVAQLRADITRRRQRLNEAHHGEEDEDRIEC